MTNTSKLPRRPTFVGLSLLATLAASAMVGGIFFASVNVGIRIGGFSISIPSIRIPD